MPTDSDDYLSSDNKRKERESQSPFRRAKRVTRTPQKHKIQEVDTDDGEQDTNSLLKKILQEMQQIRSDNKDFKDEMKILKKENNTLRKELEETKKTLAQVESRVEYFEKEVKKKNIVITGLQIDSRNESEIKNTVEHFINKYLQENIKIESAVKLGERTCLIRMNNLEEKIRVMEKKSKLRFINDGRFYINDDLTHTERKIQQEIREKYTDFKNKGRNVKRGYKTITIDGVVWRWGTDGKIKKGANDPDGPKN